MRNDLQPVLDSFTLTYLEADAFDLSVLTYMAYRTASVVEQTFQQSETQKFPLVSYVDEPHGGIHRISFYEPPEVHTYDLRFVGFVSCKQPSLVDGLSEQLMEADRHLVQALAGGPGLVSYSSLELRDGNWCNLVIFRKEEAKDHLLGTPMHRYAAYTLAPKYYAWIRLHHGIIPAGQLANGLHLQMTKYYTFGPNAAQPDIRIQLHQPIPQEIAVI